MVDGSNSVKKYFSFLSSLQAFVSLFTAISSPSLSTPLCTSAYHFFSTKFSASHEHEVKFSDKKEIEHKKQVEDRHELKALVATKISSKEKHLQKGTEQLKQSEKHLCRRLCLFP
ncbi:hypothetical protein V6N13_096241 [Hibiscus sabdariffa]|uniref:Uncharacterized protein n=1 Tax=Hibiscus sabdariffa TaxID=183260 RepID=A0ABR2DGB5_9ROSI